MRMIFNLVSASAIGLAVAASGASANTGLQNESDINAGLFAVAVADKIRRSCDDISARIFKARSYVNGLKDMASDRGYSDAEIEHYVSDKAEKAKMRARRDAYFASKGASKEDPASLCRLGQDEIAKKSQIGALLKAK